jgi:hypothetical protein
MCTATRAWLSALALAGVASALGAGCGARPFDSQSMIETLRVVGVRADDSIPTPGTDVSLELLAFDGSPHAIGPDGKPRAIEIAWIGGCADPAGDLYYKCYDGMQPALDAFAAGASSPLVGHGAKYTWRVPDDLISRRAVNGGSGKSKYKYGLSYVFYAVCAGKIVTTGATDVTSPRLGCVDSNGAPVSSDGFVYGYLPLYSYPGLSNQNPVVTGGTFDDKAPSTQSCTTDAECATGEACGTGGTCLRVIVSCPPRSGSCASYEIKPRVDPSSAEPDPLQTLQVGAPRNEVVYVDFLSSAGATHAGPTNVVIDPVTGPRDDYAGTWEPPQKAVGETRIWALVHDNRQGLTWWSVDVVVR